MLEIISSTRSGALSAPAAAGRMETGERGRLLQRINIQLSKFNNKEVARATKMLTALTD